MALGSVVARVEANLGAAQPFAAAQIEAALLDRGRQVFGLELSLPPDEPDATGRRAAAPCGDWEPQPRFYDATETRIYPTSPTPYDARIGVWRFTTPFVAPLALWGRVFDVAAATADLLERWIALVAPEYDLAAGDKRLARTQQAQRLLELAALWRARSAAWPGRALFDAEGVDTARMTLADFNAPGVWWR